MLHICKRMSPALTRCTAQSDAGGGRKVLHPYNEETNLITSISIDEFDVDDNLTVTSWCLQTGSASYILAQQTAQ